MYDILSEKRQRLGLERGPQLFKGTLLAVGQHTERRLGTLKLGVVASASPARAIHQNAVLKVGRGV